MKTKSILLLICIAMLTSCAGKFGVMKRRYNKGFYVSVTGDRKTPVKHERQEKARTAQSENEQITVSRVDTPVNNQSVATVVTPENKEPYIKNQGDQSASLYASAERPKVSVFKARSLAREIKTQANADGSQATNANAIVLIILCIFLPPLAVYLFHNAINADFWLSLILTLLFWVPGVVYAFLVCFAGVSIA